MADGLKRLNNHTHTSTPPQLSNDRTMKESPRRRVAVTSSLNQISTDQLGTTVGLLCVGWGGVTPPDPIPFTAKTEFLNF